MANSKISALTSATTPLAGTETLPIVQSSTTKQVSVANLTAGRAVSMLSLTADTTTLVVDSTNHRVGIGTSTPNNDAEVFASSGNTFLRVANGNGSANVMLVPSQTSATRYSWLLGSQYNISNTFEITPSTAVGGTTFSTPAFTISSGGNIGFKTGNLVQGTAANGINFTANTPLAGMTSQLLNWYEEGTFTTTWTNLTGTPSNTTIYYTRVGRLVYFTYPAGANVITGTANSSRFTLPFTPTKPSVGAMITDAAASAGTILIWTGGTAYPTTFSAGSLTFSGTYTV